MKTVGIGVLIGEHAAPGCNVVEETEGNFHPIVHLVKSGEGEGDDYGGGQGHADPLQ